MNREQPGPPLPLLPPPPMPPMPPPPPLPPRENRYHNEGAPYHQGPQPLFGPNDFGPPDAYYQNHNDMRPDMPYYAQESDPYRNSYYSGQYYDNGHSSYSGYYDPYVNDNNNAYAVPSTSGEFAAYSQLNPEFDYKQSSNDCEEGEIMNDGSTVNYVDDSDDWRHCSVCELDFEDEKAYNRHVRGLNHTQRILAKEKSAGLLEEPAQNYKETVNFQADDELLSRKNMFDPDRRDLLPSEVGGQTFDERWFCKHCNCSCSGKDAYESHLKGKRHAKTLKHKVAAGIAVEMPVAGERPKNLQPSILETVDTGRPAIVQEKVDRCSQPLIGLKYIVEYISPVCEPRYVCNLCEAKCDGNTVFSHLIGFKHRLRYLKEIRSDVYAEIQLCAEDRDQQTELLNRRSSEIESEEGRPMILQRTEVIATNSSKAQPPQQKGSSKLSGNANVSGEINVQSIFSREVYKSAAAKSAPQTNISRRKSPSAPKRGHERRRKSRSPPRRNSFEKRRRSPSPPRENNNNKRKRSPSPKLECIDMSVSLSDDEWDNKPNGGVNKNQPNFFNNNGEVLQKDDLTGTAAELLSEDACGYYHRERNYSKYDEIYVRPFEGGQKQKEEISKVPPSKQPPPAANNPLMSLLGALVKATMTRDPKNNKDALKLSTVLTKAILKVKEERLKNNNATNTPTPPPATASPATKEMQGNSSISTEIQANSSLSKQIGNRNLSLSNEEMQRNSSLSQKTTTKAKLGSGYFR